MFFSVFEVEDADARSSVAVALCRPDRRNFTVEEINRISVKRIRLRKQELGKFGAFGSKRAETVGNQNESADQPESGGPELNLVFGQLVVVLAGDMDVRIVDPQTLVHVAAVDDVAADVADPSMKASSPMPSRIAS